MEDIKVSAMDTKTPGEDDGFRRQSNEHIHMGSILASVARKTPTTTTSALERNCEEHYQVLERQFALDCKWTWYVHGILTLVSIGMYLVVMG